MYTFKDLESKSLKELKEIGYQLDKLPTGDRRCRQNWIDVIADVQPPLLQLLETSPAAEVELIESAIEEVWEDSPSLGSELCEIQITEPLSEYIPSEVPCPNCNRVHGLFVAQNDLGNVVRCQHCTYSKPKTYSGPIRTLAQESAAFYAKGDRVACSPRPPP